MSGKKTNPNITNQNDGRKSLIEAVRTPVFYEKRIRGGISIPLGTTRNGGMEILDFTENHHLLVAGSVMSGKTEFINGIIASVALSCLPEEVQLLLLDTTRVELLSFSGLPHLVQPVVITMEEALQNLYRIADEAASRAQMMRAAGTEDIRAYNLKKDRALRLPCLLVVIYELSDLMYGFHDETEALLTRITRNSPDTGIYLVIATQRPEPAVIPDKMRAAFPARICFSVIEEVDSVTVLGAAGAEKLSETGEMLYRNPHDIGFKLYQSFSITEAEIEQLVTAGKHGA
jgi:DNA segregation ATPase FtsK/SpoIIIE, S-DNA-T family